jgi:membrane protein YdbS with pleckstrin-like domain
MSPAADHRQASPRAVSTRILRVSTRLLVASMGPLAIGLALELYLVGFVISKTWWVAAIAAALFVFIVIFWFVLPNRERRRRRSSVV